MDKNYYLEFVYEFFHYHIVFDADTLDNGGSNGIQINHTIGIVESLSNTSPRYKFL